NPPPIHSVHLDIWQDTRACDWITATRAPGRTVTLTLTRAGKSRDGEWSTDDYDVFEGSRLIGHIVLTTQGPQGVPWFWEITARLKSTQNRGYAVSCEQALKELKARWANPARF
ncbi:MAG: hypothetical protein WCB61_10430, partial [Pseudolabrys sp.]